MGKQKRKRIGELATFDNVFQMDRSLKGRWHSGVFNNANPITLELACGKGDYAVELARRFPGRNFIGIDIKGPRLWRGAKTALEENLNNVVFLRTYIDHITEYFHEKEADEIWITFPDPFPGKSRKRLTAPMFLGLYRKILKPGALLHLKTDDEDLFRFSCDSVINAGGSVLYASSDLYSGSLPDENLSIQTFYERKHRSEGRTIKYLRFSL